MPCQCGNDPCGCRHQPCEPCGCGHSGDDPQEIPPGLLALPAGDLGHRDAFARMRDRLSAADLPGLRALTVRNTDAPLDPALALLDGWACLSDVLGFYNDRFANEHYLGTCTERQSAVGLAALVGYQPRPGAASDVYLAFTLDDQDKEAALEVPLGTRVYSQPGPGETMQPFETMEPLSGRPRWSAMRPRLSEPQYITDKTTEFWFKGISTGLRKGDALLIEIVNGSQRGSRGELRIVAKVEVFPGDDRTKVTLVPRPEQASPGSNGGENAESIEIDLATLTTPATIDTTPSITVPINPETLQVAGSFAGSEVLGAVEPTLAMSFAKAVGGSTPDGPTGKVNVYAMRIKAGIHGNNAPLIPVWNQRSRIVERYYEWNLNGTGPSKWSSEDANQNDKQGAGEVAPVLNLNPESPACPLAANEIALDAVYDTIVRGSLVWIRLPGEDNKLQAAPSPFRVRAIRTESRPHFNLLMKVTILTLEDWKTASDSIWRQIEGEGDLQSEFAYIRSTVVYAQSEALELVEMSIEGCLGGASIELDGYYDGLKPGRRLIVAGEREDLGDIIGVSAAELVMIANVEHRVRTDEERNAAAKAQYHDDSWAQNTLFTASTKDTIHTFVTLAEGSSLSYCYKRDTVTIYGNVTHATHGETRTEVLGGGDPRQALQTFALRQHPLTWVGAANASGIASTLDIRVNDLLWHEAAHPAAVVPSSRTYITRTGDDAVTKATFGLGTRLPAGLDNVRARYRTGIGFVGNVRAGQASVLAARPNGVMAVTNPIPATGGVDPDDLAQIRTRAPIGLAALDRIVSESDLLDFARSFARIGKASVTGQGNGNTLILWIAGENDAPLDPDPVGDALATIGSLTQVENSKDKLTLLAGSSKFTITIERRKALLIAIRAIVRLEPDREWVSVEPKIRQALYRAFGFAARDFRQALDPSEVMVTIQSVPGVAWVDLRSCATIATTYKQDNVAEDKNDSKRIEEAFQEHPTTTSWDLIKVNYGEIAWLSPDAPSLLILEEMIP